MRDAPTEGFLDLAKVVEYCKNEIKDREKYVSGVEWSVDLKAVYYERSLEHGPLAMTWLHLSPVDKPDRYVGGSEFLANIRVQPRPGLRPYTLYVHNEDGFKSTVDEEKRYWRRSTAEAEMRRRARGTAHSLGEALGIPVREQVENR